MKEKLIWPLTVLVCVIILSWVYLNVGRYSSIGGRLAVMDHVTGKVYVPSGEFFEVYDPVHSRKLTTLIDTGPRNNLSLDEIREILGPSNQNGNVGDKTP